MIFLKRNYFLAKKIKKKSKKFLGIKIFIITNEKSHFKIMSFVKSLSFYKE